MHDAAAPEGRRRLWALLVLTRPANVVTALADVLAGSAVAGVLAGGVLAAGWPAGLGWLLLATALLYAGGVVLNDVFDAALDARERPERPIPSGHVTRGTAAGFGALLLLGGVAASALASWAAAVLAAFIALAAVFYDALGKHHPVIGPLSMGLCRGANLMLGVSILPAMLPARWFLIVLPVAYIAAITAVSRGEVHGGRRGTGVLALALLAFVVGSLAGLPFGLAYRLWHALPFLLLFTVQVAPAFVRAAWTPAPAVIRRAVRAGVLGLITLDATLAAGFAGWIFGLVVLLLLPVSVGLARRFAVT